jgi:hypothetical protein
LASKLKKSTLVSFLICSATFSTALSAQIPASTEQEDIQIFNMSNFTELRSGLLNLMSAAKQRIWLVSDYLTDGEIVTALYIGQYRGVDVKVLLGKRKSNLYMSRLRYLKNQNIPVYYKPEKFPSGYSSQMLIDGTLYKISGELNFLDKSSAFKIQKATKIELAAYIEEFQKAAGKNAPTIPDTMPLVGTPRHNARGEPLGASRAPVSARERVRATPPSRSEPAPYVNHGDTYNYDRNPQSRDVPQGLARKLPSKTIAQERDQNSLKAMTPSPVPVINKEAEAFSEPMIGDQP